MYRIRLAFIFVVAVTFAKAQQPETIDKVIGVVNRYSILLSDLQNAMIDAEAEGLGSDRCKTFETLVFTKLLLAQADRDSVTVTDAEVDTELNRRMAYFINKFGSEEKLEKFYGKRTNVLKDDFRPDVADKLTAEKMRSKINTDTKLTPAEVRLYYKSIPEDSLPLINSEVELQQLVKRPSPSMQARKEARELLESYRERIVSGKSTMAVMARLYSEDPGSAKDGGFIPNVARGMMVPEFEAVAFRLKNGEVSNIFETSYGYHFIELVQRKGEMLDLRHILVIPKMNAEDYYRSKTQLDSIYTEIKEGRLVFEEAVRKFSDDADTKQNGGLMVNPNTANTKFDNETLSLIDANFIATLNGMKNGDISKPMRMEAGDGKPGYRVIKLKNRIEPHKANLKDDYQRISQMALLERNQKQLKDWIRKRSKITYIKLDPEYSCKFENDWTINN